MRFRPTKYNPVRLFSGVRICVNRALCLQIVSVSQTHVVDIYVCVNTYKFNPFVYKANSSEHTTAQHTHSFGCSHRQLARSFVHSHSNQCRCKQTNALCNFFSSHFKYTHLQSRVRNVNIIWSEIEKKNTHNKKALNTYLEQCCVFILFRTVLTAEYDTHLSMLFTDKKNCFFLFYWNLVIYSILIEIN